VVKEVRLDLNRAGAEFMWQHTHAGTRGTLIPVLHVVSVPQLGRRSMYSVAIFAPSRPSLKV